MPHHGADVDDWLRPRGAQLAAEVHRLSRRRAMRQLEE